MAELDRRKTLDLNGPLDAGVVGGENLKHHVRVRSVGGEEFSTTHLAGHTGPNPFANERKFS